jgi:molecular chaperone GrpE (heat shock protein)
MITEQTPPALAKWPFFLANALLLIVAGLILYRHGVALDFSSGLMVAGCVALGAWVSVTPFLVEYRGHLKYAEAHKLAATVEQIKNLQNVADQISVSTAQWQIIHENSEKSVAAAKEIGERMAAEAKAFGEFMQKANDTEKTHLRVETDKLRRNEAEWLQIVVRLLDHGHALHQASVRFGHPAVVEQLGRFQSATREIVRRVGLAPFAANPGDAFDEARHQLIDPDAAPSEHARVSETLATGYHFQGQIIRRALVALQQKDSTEMPSVVTAGAAAQFDSPTESTSPED